MRDRAKLKLDVLQATAREATRTVLSQYPQFATVRVEALTLGTGHEGDVVIFELYLPGDRPSDALVLITTEVDPYSGVVLAVEVHQHAWRKLAQQAAAGDARNARA